MCIQVLESASDMRTEDLYAHEAAAIERINPDTDVMPAEFKIVCKSLLNLMIAAETVLSLFGMDKPDCVHELAKASAEAGYDLGHVLGEPTVPAVFAAMTELPDDAF